MKTLDRQAEREAFEAAVRGRFAGDDGGLLDRYANGDYRHGPMEMMWMMWKVRADQARAHDERRVQHHHVELMNAWQERDRAKAEADALRKLLLECIDTERFADDPPCYLCGYNGPNYFQSDTHPCAESYHAAIRARKESL